MNNLYAHTALNLVAVLILMLSLFYLLKKFKMTKYVRDNHIKIINTVAIGSKERVILIEVNKTFLLVGATPSHIETLYVFNELEALKPVTTSLPAESFSEQIAALNKG